MTDAIALLRPMMLIRAFEEALMRRPDHGFQLLSSGEEAVAVGLCAALRPEDALLSSGRSIGPALARGVDPGAVMAELELPRPFRHAVGCRGRREWHPYRSGGGGERREAKNGK